MRPARIGILGGTFDPIHYGHIIPAQYAFDHLQLDRLLLVPSASPVHRPRHQPAPACHRLRMCELAAEPLPGFEASDVEVRRTEPSYTVLTLEALRAALGGQAELVLLIGEDNLPLLPSWYRIGDILQLARVAVLPRPTDGPVDEAALRAGLGPATAERVLASRIPAPLVPISATEIRRRVASGEPIDALVPDAVAAYISDHGLYR